MGIISKFIPSFSLRKLLANKRFTVTASIIMSFALWLFIVINEKPIIDRSFTDKAVTIDLNNTLASEEGLQITSDIASNKFKVEVQGPSYLISALKNEDINLYASAAKVNEPGTYDLDVIAMFNDTNKGYEVIKIEPSTVKVSFDYIKPRVFSISTSVEGIDVKEGLINEGVLIRGVENESITITGPSKILDKIETVEAYTAKKKTISASTSLEADIRLLDKNKKEIPTDNLTLSANKVEVTIMVSKQKTVPIKAVFSNLPEGLKASSIPFTIKNEAVTYKEVTIIGKPETVDKINEIKLSPIDITQVNKSSKSYDTSAELPDGIRLKDNIEVFKVEFNISNYITKKIDVSEYSFKKLGENLKAGGDEIKNVTLIGPRNLIYKLQKEDVYAIIELSGKKVGEYTVNPLFGIKNNGGIWVTGTYETIVNVKKK